MLLMLVDWARQKRLSKHGHWYGMTFTGLETAMDNSIPKIFEGKGSEKNPFLRFGNRKGMEKSIPSLHQTIVNAFLQDITRYKNSRIMGMQYAYSIICFEYIYFVRSNWEMSQVIRAMKVPCSRYQCVLYWKEYRIFYKTKKYHLNQLTDGHHINSFQSDWLLSLVWCPDLFFVPAK